MLLVHVKEVLLLVFKLFVDVLVRNALAILCDPQVLFECILCAKGAFSDPGADAFVGWKDDDVVAFHEFAKSVTLAW